MNSIKEIVDEVKKESVSKKATTENILSKVLPSGEMLETIYNPVTQETKMVVCKDSEIEILNCYKSENGSEFLPFPSGHDLLVKNFVKIASGVSDYGDIQKLFLEVKNFVDKYMKLPDEFLTVSAVYILLTWVYDCFHTLPYLRVLGDYGTGKTRFQEVVGSICYKAILAGASISKAAVFRTMDLIRGTFVFDEADFKSSDMWSDIIKILNAGHTKGFPVTRMNVEKDGKMTIGVFEVYGPKVLASRERFGDEALESRCLTQNLFQMKSNDRPIHLSKEFEVEAEELRNKLLTFRMCNYDKVKVNSDTVKDLSFPRLKQSALALTSVANFIGNDVLKEVVNFLLKYEKDLVSNQQTDIKADILFCVAVILAQVEKKTYKMRMTEISNMFDQKFYDDFSDREHKIYETQHGVYSGRPDYIIQPRKVATCVRKLGIRTERDADGFYIPIPQETEKIELLVKRYGMEDLIQEQLGNEKKDEEEQKTKNNLF